MEVLGDRDPGLRGGGKAWIDWQGGLFDQSTQSTACTCWDPQVAAVEEVPCPIHLKLQRTDDRTPLVEVDLGGHSLESDWAVSHARPSDTGLKSVEGENANTRTRNLTGHTHWKDQFLDRQRDTRPENLY